MVKAASPDIRVHSQTLWFGVVEHGQARQPTDMLFIGNYGSAPWSAQLSLGVDWLSVPGNVRTITIPPGQVLRLPVTLQQVTRYLAIGATHVPRAVVLQDSTNREWVIDARVIAAAPSARINVQPPQIAFGKRAVQQPGRSDTPIVLTNSGTIRWNVLDVRAPAWVQLSREPSGIEPGRPEPLSLSLNPALLSEPRQYNAALEIVGDGGQTVSIPLSVEVVPIKMQLRTNNPKNPQWLQLRKSSTQRRGVARDAGAAIILKNDGETPFTVIWGQTSRKDVNLVVRAFLALEPHPEPEFTLNPNDERIFQVRLLREMSIAMKDVIVLNLPGNQPLSIGADFQGDE